MVTTFTAKSSIVKIPEISIIDTSTDSEILYTCPTGKKAKVKIIARCTNTGAAVEARIGIFPDGAPENTNFMRWRNQVITSASYGSVPENSLQGLSNVDYMMTGTLGKIDVTLEEGDEINTNQDSGTNATIDYSLTILELPA